MSVVIATAKWDILVGTDVLAATTWEETLRAKFWNVPAHHSSTVHRLCKESDSAWRIVDDIVRKSTQKERRRLAFNSSVKEWIRRNF